MSRLIWLDVARRTAGRAGRSGLACLRRAGACGWSVAAESAGHDGYDVEPLTLQYTYFTSGGHHTKGVAAAGLYTTNYNFKDKESTWVVALLIMAGGFMTILEKWSRSFIFMRKLCAGATKRREVVALKLSQQLIGRHVIEERKRVDAFGCCCPGVELLTSLLHVHNVYRK